MSGGTRTFSLYEDLTKLSYPAGASWTQPPAAVELVDFLLKGVGKDACEATYNAQLLYRLTRRARDICNEIMGYIHQVETTPVFDAFDKYTELIEPLELELYNVAAIPPPPDTTSVIASIEDLLLPYHTWNSARKTSVDVLRALWSPPFIVLQTAATNEIAAAQKYDDLSYLLAIGNDVETAATEMTDDEALLDAIRETTKTLSDIAEALRASSRSEEDAVQLSIRSALLLHGIASRKTSTEASNIEERAEDDSTWEEATAILSKLHTAIKESRNVTNISTEWIAWERNLLTEVPQKTDISALVTALMKHAGRIRRPYYAQAFTLVNQCHRLEEATQQAGNARMVDAMKDAVEAAEKALQLAIQEVNHFEQFSWDAIKTQNAYKAFGDAVAKLQQAYIANKVTGSVAEAMDAARQRDRKAVEALAQNYGRLLLRASPSPSTNIRVALRLSPPDNEGSPRSAASIDIGTYNINSMTTVEGVMWHVIPQRSVAALSRNARFFRAESNGAFEPLSGHTSLSNAARNNRITLHVVVSDVAGFRADTGI